MNTTDDYAAFAEDIAAEVAMGNTGLRFWCHATVASFAVALAQGGFNLPLAEPGKRMAAVLYGKLAEISCSSTAERDDEQVQGLFVSMLANAMMIHDRLATKTPVDFAEIYEAIRSSSLSRLFDDNELLRCCVASDMALCRIVWGIEPRSGISD